MLEIVDGSPKIAQFLINLAFPSWSPDFFLSSDAAGVRHGAKCPPSPELACPGPLIVSPKRSAVDPESEEESISSAAESITNDFYAIVRDI